MNFLFHRHLAERDLDSSQAALGAMLPDLWRMADRGLRARAGASLDNPLGRGIRHHLELDSWFHKQPIFLDGQAATGEELARIDAPRLRLFAHISWELCLDGALIRRFSLETTLANLRRSLSSTPRREHAEAMRAHRPDTDGALQETALDRLEGLFVSLDRGDWVAGYAHGEGLVARLDGVRRRFNLPRLEAGARDQAAASFERLLALASSRLGEMLEGSLDVARP